MLILFGYIESRGLVGSRNDVRIFFKLAGSSSMAYTLLYI